ncbi:hypothetical protein [Jeongeupia naejangsanensis]|uniref:Uncharacterized protein n=1 Tax=Jeongeupia naejangsanensis TaxID=613195 RepID=A0ABS2BLD1_9NEIS|nr:hypothetical protein [Jeongeupia naejangsanensis]MBM3116401.1 hypothetical protein [Jeongeupia naejangsanensis]
MTRTTPPLVALAAGICWSTLVLSPFARGMDKVEPDNRDITELNEALTTLRSSIGHEVGIPKASDRSQCVVLPIGAQPCGGPSDYLVYSMQVSDTARLQALVTQYTALQRRRNEQTQTAGICSVRPVPDATVESGRCVLTYGATDLLPEISSYERSASPEDVMSGD